MKPFKPHYIVCDKAYDTKNMITIINEEINAFDIIPNKRMSKQDISENKADMFSEKTNLQLTKQH